MLEKHLVGLRELADLAPERVLPAHGNPQIIASGGYGTAIIRHTEDYIKWLLRAVADPSMRSTPLRDVLGGALDRGSCTYYQPYEYVHQINLTMMLGPQKTAE